MDQYPKHRAQCYQRAVIYIQALKKYDVIMKLVSHDEFIHFDLEVLSKSKSIIFDLKGDLKGKNVITL